MTKTIVKFLKPSTRYNTGDVAGFDAVTAGSLIAAKIAIAYTPPSTSVAALSTNTEEGMAQVRQFALSEQSRLQAMADAIQARGAEDNEKLEARERAVKAREDDVAKREAALDQGQAPGATAGASTVIAAEQSGDMPANGATPPTGEGHEGDETITGGVTEGDTVTGDQRQDDLPAQGTTKKGK